MYYFRQSLTRFFLFPCLIKNALIFFRLPVNNCVSEYFGTFSSFISLIGLKTLVAQLELYVYRCPLFLFPAYFHLPVTASPEVFRLGRFEWLTSALVSLAQPVQA